MGAVRIKVQTADKKHHNNSQVVHTTSPSVDISLNKKTTFVRNKSIIKAF